MAGLSCAAHLHRAGVAFTMLEAADGVGGRVRTDELGGFRLDRGFQIFLTSYPEAQAALDYAALDLRPFYAGALVWWDGAFHRVADPVRHFGDGVASLANPVGTPLDKALVGLFRLRMLLKSPAQILAGQETSTLARLQAEGFSAAIIDRFFRPFLGGIFFDRGLGTTSRLFELVMRCLATGENCLPAGGIGAVARQLAQQLPPGSVHTGVALLAGRMVREASRARLAVPAPTPRRAEERRLSSTGQCGRLWEKRREARAAGGAAAVRARGAAHAEQERLRARALCAGVRATAAAAGSVALEGGRAVAARRGVVVATDARAAEALLGGALAASPSKREPGVGTCNLYFRAPAPPRQENILYLNGERGGLVNNCCFPSTVAPSYAPPGQALVSVSTIGTQDDMSDEQLAEAAKAELAAWFGDQHTATWELLRVYRIPFAQPNQAPPTDLSRPVRLAEGLFVCGDHRDSATLDGALKSGRRAAEAVLAEPGRGQAESGQPAAAQQLAPAAAA